LKEGKQVCSAIKPDPLVLALSHHFFLPSPLPLSTLAENVSQKLFECHEMKWITEAVSSKIKLLSMRKPYMDISSSSKSTVDLFEDDSQDRMWRWEILTIGILPSQVLPMVRKARSARKKLSYHRIATTRLIQALTDAETVIANPALPKMDKQIAKVSQNEEKVLKFEREAEKKRMEEQAKKRKQEEVESKKREKELEKELKKLEAEKKKQETEAKKDEAAKAREEAKRKREVEKEQKEVQKKTEEEQQKKKLNSQKACLMSFFSGPPKKKARTPSNASADDSTGGSQAARSNSVASDSFDVNAFRTMVNSSDTQSKGPLFSILSSQAIASRKRRIGKVALSVYVTVEPENAFDAQPFAEEKRIIFSNKYRLLSFHEDRRPAYHGTWSKKSTKVTGRTPFGKDAMYLDYDYQSEGEWEEGDDEIGEDIEDEDKCKDDDDDEGEARIYDYDDGFCVADDRYLDSEDDVDEETKVLHKKKLQKGEGQGSLANRVCIVAPATGGIPATGNTSFSDRIEGFEKQEGVNILLSHQAIALCDARLCLDAFPPALIDDSQAPAQATASSPGEVAGKDEYSSDEMRALARLAHHCELNSKEKLIEALRNADPTMFTSRAKATRKLDTIAVKKRFVNTTGVYWEVKKEVLEQLELHDVLVSKPCLFCD
jgi:chromatin assembly factor 1 subunit A